MTEYTLFIGDKLVGLPLGLNASAWRLIIEIERMNNNWESVYIRSKNKVVLLTPNTRVLITPLVIERSILQKLTLPRESASGGDPKDQINPQPAVAEYSQISMVIQNG